MSDHSSVAALFRYSDQANRQVLDAAAQIDAASLDQPLDLGPGTLRKILQHILIGESTWLERISGHVEAKWGGEGVPVEIDDIRKRFETLYRERESLFGTLTPASWSQMQRYRDSRGSLFQATLQDMILQCLVHSIHHRAQAVNAIRRLGGHPPEVDYMVALRQPAT